MLKIAQRLAITAIVGFALGISLPAVADDVDTTNNLDATPEASNPIETPETLSEVFNRAFFENTGNYYDAVGIGTQINTILGFKTFPGSYPETEVARDAELLTLLYQSALEQQVASGPPLRTPDLSNPFDTSLLLNPSYYGSVDVVQEALIPRQTLPD